MFDNDDLDFVFLALFTDIKTVFSLLFLIVLFVFIYFSVQENYKQCSKKHCDSGSPTVIKNDCVCVEKAK